jgi:RTX toxin RtxA
MPLPTLVKILAVPPPIIKVNLEGSGNTMSLVVGRANIITRISSLEDFTVTISPLDSVKILAVPPIIKAALNPLPIWVNILPPAENINANVGPLPAMVGSANIFTHIGNGFSVAFAIGQANIVTKIGSGDLITAAIGQANIVTHVNLEGSGAIPNMGKYISIAC